MATTWPDGSTTTYAASAIGPLWGREVLGWYDVRYFGAECDLKPVSGTMVAGSAALTAGANWSTADAGKLVRLRGAGAVLATASDGAMSTSVSYNRNILTSAGASFTNALLGRRVVVTGAITTINTWVWEVISATQLRLGVNVSATATSLTYTVSEDLYATVLSATNSGPSSGTGTALLDTLAGTAVTSTVGVCATDDAAAIQAAIAAAVVDSPRNIQASAPTIFIPYSTGIGSTIQLSNVALAASRTGRLRILGQGLQGFSDLLGRGSVVISPLKPRLTALMRWAPPGGGLGRRGSITSGTKILTDPEGVFLSTAAAGNAISIIGAGTQAGSQTRVALNATISSVDSDTQMTISTNALTTVTEGVYSWVDNSKAHSGFDSFSIERIHFMGASGHLCGVHSIAANSYEMIDVTCSDFRSGIGHYADGMVNGSTMMDIRTCRFNDCYTGVLAAGNPGGTLVFTGVTYMDGNSNLVSVMPGEGTVAIDCNSNYAMGDVVIQAYYTGLYSEGRAYMRGLRLEAIQKGIDLRGDGANLGKSHTVTVKSWSTTSVGGSTGRGLVLGAGCTNTRFEPGYYVNNNIGMYTDSDATSLLSTTAIDSYVEGAQTASYTASYTPDLALGQTVTMTLTGGVTVNAPTNATAGIILTFNFIQDATGSRNITFASGAGNYKANWTPTKAASGTDSISFRWNGSSWIQYAAAVGL